MLGSSSGSSAPPRQRTLADVLRGVFAVVAGLAAILFLSAGHLDWVEAWRFIAAYGAFLLAYGVWGLRSDPGQLDERGNPGANVKAWDKLILRIYFLLLLVVLVVAGLDAGRFRWSPAPAWLQALGWVAMALGGGMIAWAAQANTFLARYVRIQTDRGQRAVTHGPYRWVRHPMYVGIIAFMLSTPLVLGSRWALVPAALIGVLFIVRTALEDRTLQAELPGYAEYAQRVRWRLLPGVW